MLRIARERSVVIIGRCGAYVLKGHPRHVSIFLHADKEFRQKRLEQFYGVSPDEALKLTAQSDKERALYHRTLTGEKWTDASRYDLVINTGKTGLDGCVGLILKYLEIVFLISWFIAPRDTFRQLFPDFVRQPVPGLHSVFQPIVMQDVGGRQDHQ